MRKVTFATIATAGLAVATFALASPASAAPTQVGTAQDTINRLQAQGYTVIVNKVGNASLSQCSISAVRDGQTYTRTTGQVIGGPDRGGVHTTITGRTIYLDAAC
ncbi:hypothetical protein HZU38_30750 (plasmid) [Mycolicibacterium vanbaalenii]|nr:hypothetical protein [Mycolicibacterium vanbaalenii]UJL32168.1 hypothetical protein HZU38_30750 [Mycolicibacterium vanbaalenii]